MVFLSGCDRGVQKRSGILPEYDSKTGKLTLIRYDSDHNGRTDTWSYMDGARIVRIEIDRNEDGRIERWEHYAEGNTLTKVGFSRRNDGVEDAWIFGKSDGTIDRIEISTRRDGVIDRIEHYEKNLLLTAEEDT